MNPTISIIAAIQKKDRGIGKNGALLWHISDDLKRFKALTTGHSIIMGKRTFKSLGRPLPGRLNIILSRDPSYRPDGCTVCGSLKEAIRVASENNPNEIFIIGGGEIYQQALPLAQKLYLTIVESNVDADTFFPDYSEFSESKLVGEGEHDGLRYSFWEFEHALV